MKSPISKAHTASTRPFSLKQAGVQVAPKELVILSGAKDLLFWHHCGIATYSSRPCERSTEEDLSSPSSLRSVFCGI
jgi:hypothetical protein